MVPGCRDDDQSEDCHLRLQWEGRTFPCLWYSGGVVAAMLQSLYPKKLPSEMEVASPQKLLTLQIQKYKG